MANQTEETKKSIISEKDYDLLKEFIQREAKDFTPNKNDEWIEAVFKLIIERTNKLKDTDRLHINSYGNAGGLARSLILDVYNGEHNKDYEVMLCTCGKLNHTVKIQEKK